jgi:hypothetical protein
MDLLRVGSRSAIIKDSALKVRRIVQPGSAQFGGKACRTSDCRRLADANFYSTSPDMFLGEEVEAFAMMADIVKLRRFGGDCSTVCSHWVITTSYLKPISSHTTTWHWCRW